MVKRRPVQRLAVLKIFTKKFHLAPLFNNNLATVVDASGRLIEVVSGRHPSVQPLYLGIIKFKTTHRVQPKQTAA